MRLETPQSALTASDGRWTGGTAIVAIRRPDVIAIGIDSLSQDIRSGKATRVRKICYANGVVFASAGVTSIETIPFDIRRLAAGSLKGNNLADKVASFEQAARQPMRAVFEYLRQTNTQPPHESLGPGKPILSIVFASQMAGTLAPFSKDY
ncbi:MAG TPA: hypothetical protein VN893_18530, partial [Bryobacteraceae bacterium]|nr:hypothetical protein [Bryobacteraceae bacterium]